MQSHLSFFWSACFSNGCLPDEDFCTWKRCKNTAMKVTKCVRELKRFLCKVKNKTYSHVETCIVVIQARLVFGSVLIIQMWSDLCHVSHANWERLCCVRWKSFVSEMSQTSLLSEISVCIPSCSVESSNSLHNCFRQGALMWHQVDLEWGNKSNRKLVGLILSSNYSTTYWRRKVSLDVCQWKVIKMCKNNRWQSLQNHQSKE